MTRRNRCHNCTFESRPGFGANPIQSADAMANRPQSITVQLFVTAVAVFVGSCRSDSAVCQFDYNLQRLDFLTQKDRARLIDIMHDKTECIVSVNIDAHHTRAINVKVRSLSVDEHEVICTRYRWGGSYGHDDLRVSEEYRVREPTAVGIFRQLYRQIALGDCYRRCEGTQLRSSTNRPAILTFGSASGMVSYVEEVGFWDMAFVVIGKELDDLNGKAPIGGAELFPRLTPEHVASVHHYVISAVDFFDEACELYARLPTNQAVGP